MLFRISLRLLLPHIEYKMYYCHLLDWSTVNAVPWTFKKEKRPWAKLVFWSFFYKGPDAVNTNKILKNALCIFHAFIWQFYQFFGKTVTKIFDSSCTRSICIQSNARQNTNKMKASSIPRGTWSLSKDAWGTRRGTPWMWCQSIAGHNDTPVHTQWTLWTCQSTYHACFWTGDMSLDSARGVRQHNLSK